jgi:hypothetical protein
MVRARYTEQILDECCRNILKQRSDLKPEALNRTRELMRQAIRDCMVTGYEPLIDGLVLPDPDDRHVLAAAIRASSLRRVPWPFRSRRRRAPRRYPFSGLFLHDPELGRSVAKDVVSGA